MDGFAAPAGGVDVGDGLGERPAMASEVDGVVLAFAVHVVGGRGGNGGAVLPGVFAMRFGVGDADHDAVDGKGGRTGLRELALVNDEAAVAGAHLDAMVADTKTDGEAEGGAEPFGCNGWVGVVEGGDNGAGWNGAIGEHEDSRSRTRIRSWLLVATAGLGVRWMCLAYFGFSRCHWLLPETLRRKHRGFAEI